LLHWGLNTVFVGGSTGESHSLTVEERLTLAQRWSEVVRGSTLRLVVHVGSSRPHSSSECSPDHGGSVASSRRAWPSRFL
jgi:dihydrodipicolinate synthase/N-acetylneuraminate lyase